VPVYFLDTSALGKRYIAERGSLWLRALLSSSYWIHEMELGLEPGEVAVGGVERGTVFNRERGEMRVRRQIARRAGGVEKHPQHAPVTLTRMNRHDQRMEEPPIHNTHCLLAG